MAKTKVAYLPCKEQRLGDSRGIRSQSVREGVSGARCTVVSPTATFRSVGGLEMRRLKRLAQVGRSHDSFTFNITGLTVDSGPLANLYNSPITLRVWRNQKFYSTEEVMVARDGHATWPSALQVPCTLYQSKQGKVYSSKYFSVSLLAREGNRLREIARDEVDFAVFMRRDAAMASLPQASTLHLVPRSGKRGNSPIVLRWQVSVVRRDTAAGEADNDSDDVSRADSSSTLASGTVVTMSKVALQAGESALEQDLRGFDDERNQDEPGTDLLCISEGDESELSLRDAASPRAARAPDGAGAQHGAQPTGAASTSGTSPSPLRVYDAWQQQQQPQPPQPQPPQQQQQQQPPQPQPQRQRQQSAQPATASRPAAGNGESSGVVNLGDVQGAVVQTRDGLAVAPSVAAAAAAAATAATRSMEAGVPGAVPGNADLSLLLKAGWLRKRAVSAPTMLKNWRLRYVVLSPMLRAVLWYRTPESIEPQGLLSLIDYPGETSCHVPPGPDGEPGTRIRIQTGRKELILEGASADIIEEWRIAVQAMLDATCSDIAQPPTEDGSSTKGGCVIL